MPLLNDLANARFDSERLFSDVVHFVHVIVVEPHPQAPDASPYGGRVREARYSTVAQPETYAERVEVSAMVAALLVGNQILLVDELSTTGMNNPVWCTYGTAPNSAYLIRQDGVLEVVQLWLDVVELEAAIHLIVK